MYSSAYFRNPATTYNTPTSGAGPGAYNVLSADHKFRRKVYGVIVGFFLVNIAFTTVVIAYVVSRLLDLSQPPSPSIGSEWKLCKQCDSRPATRTSEDGQPLHEYKISNSAGQSGLESLCCTTKSDQFWDEMKVVSWIVCNRKEICLVKYNKVDIQYSLNRHFSNIHRVGDKSTSFCYHTFCK